jgi:serine/threonine-protein kinase
MKTLARGRGDTGSIARFVDEARLQARLEHPAIVPVYDLGTEDDGTPFFTMKRVRGVTLAAVLAAGDDRDERATLAEWSPRRLLTAFITVCQAVAYAHRCGVVHGDLKPENVMLGRFGEVHVLDWGCATRSHADGDGTDTDPDLPSATSGSETTDVGLLLGLLEEARRVGDLVGTPGYLAPELARGQRGDRRSDVYSLGAILFEIVTGRRLFDQPTPLARLVATLDREELRPSRRVPELAIAEELDALVATALHAEPESRPTASELAAGVERYLDRELERTGALRSADKHAREASVHASRALEGGAEGDREAALREAGRALALDPGNLEACEVLTRLFGSPPATLPTAARAMCEAEGDRFATSTLGAMRSRALAWAAMIVPAVLMGVRSWTMAAVTIALVLASVVVFALLARQREVGGLGRVLAATLGLGTVAAVGSLFGSLVLVPVFAATTAAMFAVGFEKRARLPICLGAVAAVALPLLLEAYGVLPPSIAFEGGTIVLLPRVVDFDPTWSAAFLVVGSLMSIPMTVMLAARLRDTVDARLAELATTEWQLRRALPSVLGERIGAALRR